MCRKTSFVELWSEPRQISVGPGHRPGVLSLGLIMAERRKEQRQRLLKAGTIAFNRAAGSPVLYETCRSAAHALASPVHSAFRTNSHSLSIAITFSGLPC